jgi:hypothetical protein
MSRPGERTAGEALRAKRQRGYFSSLDRGEVISGRVIQVLEPDGVRVVIGTAVIWAKTTGGNPGLGICQLEVVVPGEQPVLKLVVPKQNQRLDLVVDPSSEKKQKGTGGRFDRKV